MEQEGEGMRLIDMDELIKRIIQMGKHENVFDVIRSMPRIQIESLQPCKWHDAELDPPEVNEDGESKYILLSFMNASAYCIGQYRVDEEGGAYYDGDDEDPLTKIGLFVDEWMELPKKEVR